MRWSTAAAALLLCLLALAPAAYAAGELDPTFDGDGKVVTPAGFGGQINDVAIQADGKIVAAGVATPNYDTESNFLLVRYNPDGSVDTSFSGDGRATADFGGRRDFSSGVAIQSDGKIVAVGWTGSAPSIDFALARYNADGSFDRTFDGDGKVVTDLGASEAPYEFAYDIALQLDGRIVVAGVSGSDFALVRYNPDGSLDASFQGDGTVVTDFGAGAWEAHAVALQADGKIVTAGGTDVGATDDFALARYNSDGSLDTTFDADGRVVTDLGGSNEYANDLAIQTDGKIVVAGKNSTTGFALTRYNPNGSLDSTFDGDGKVATDLPGIAHSVAVQADGKIVAAGYAYLGTATQADFALARYNADGSLDAPAFGGDGKVVIDFTRTYDVVYGIAIQADGKIVGAGVSNNSFALARFLPTGSESKISVNDVTRFEGNAGVTSFAFNVSLSKPSSETVTVTRQTINGSASAPSDYAALSPGPITFMPGQTAKTVTVNVNGEVASEPNETFFLNLSSPANATIADGSGRGTIQNDDLSDSTPCTITGTNGNDVLNGTAGNDVICGGRGDDQINGLDGADVLKGEEGNDLLIGGTSYDLLIGDRGSDDLRGEGWNDTLRGGDQNDTLNGGAGSDAIFGDAGGDSLNAQDGVSANDSADGGNSSDSCVFDSGDFVTSCP